MKKNIIITVLFFIIIAIVLGLYIHLKSEDSFTFKTMTVVKGDIEQTISATGTVNPVIIVNVGAQVTGKVLKLFADYNSIVKKGDIVAKIDPELYQSDIEEGNARLKTALANLESISKNISYAEAKVKSAGAEIKREEAGLAYAQKEYERYVELFQKDLASASERDQKELAYKEALARLDSANAEQNGQKANLSSKRADYEASFSQVKSAEAALERDKTNLEYTIIRSPVDGTVVSREVDEGQTLTARMQTPLLFRIAEDLTKMQVNASIDEADIGRIKTGQQAFFTVDAFPYTTFEGSLKQVRIAPIIVQNVVTYDVIIEVENKELKLKPGMTANVTIIVKQVRNVVKIPNEALRFTPPANLKQEDLKLNDLKTGKKAGKRLKGKHLRHVWRMKNGSLEHLLIKTGITDGEYTELVSGDVQEEDALATGALDRNGKPVISKKAGSQRNVRFRGFRP